MSENRLSFEKIAAYTSELGCALSEEELGRLAVDYTMGKTEVSALETVFNYLVEKRRETSIATFLKLSRLPQKAPKTFEGFDFDRISGRDVEALKKLPTLANLQASKNLAFIGPEGVGKTHLAQAYGRQCCLNGYKAYYIKATELRDKLHKAVQQGGVPRVVYALVKPACLIIDEIGRCKFDEDCTNIFFDIVDRRYEKECPNLMILTSNTPVNNWKEFFTGNDTLLCTLDRIFDHASVFVMKGASYRGAGLETFSVEAAVQTMRLNK